MAETTQKLPAGKAVNPYFSHRILIVDDDPSVLFAFRKLIEREGLGVDTCECLGKALNQIRRVPYLAVIADLRLAGTENVDGLELIRIIRKEHIETKTILMTAYGNKMIEQTAIATGAKYYEKPVSPSAILELLNSYV